MTPANEDRPLEIERKFLIRMPDPQRLAAESTRKIRIRQIYLFIGSRIAYTPYVVGFGYPVGWMTCCVLELTYFIRSRNRHSSCQI